MIVLHPKSNINSERDFINGDINSIELRTDVGEDLLTNKISEVINRATKRYLWMKK